MFRRADGNDQDLTPCTMQPEVGQDYATTAGKGFRQPANGPRSRLPVDLGDDALHDLVARCQIVLPICGLALGGGKHCN